MWDRNRRWQLAMLLSIPTLAMAADHDEFADGDLSGDPLNPTSIAVDAGSNRVSGRVTDNPLDRDIFTLVVPSDLQVTSIGLDVFDLLTDPGDGGMLVALEAGPVISDLNSSAALRGFAIVGVAAGTQQGDDLLDDLGGGVLGPGEWTLWVQNTGSVTDWALDVRAQSTAVPPPSRTQPVPATGPGGFALLLLMISLAAGRALNRRPPRAR